VTQVGNAPAFASVGEAMDMVLAALSYPAATFAWPGGHGVAPAGPPFFKYSVDMMRELEVEAGVPVAAAVDGDDQVVSGVLPAGRYATLTPWVTPASSWRPPMRCWTGRPNRV
jgi:hypothetical protein